MIKFEHSYRWDANNPVCIFKADVTGIKRQVVGVIKVNGETISKGDVIKSPHYIGRNTSIGGGNTPIEDWVVTEIKERFTPKGYYITDPTNIGFIATVEPFQ